METLNKSKSFHKLVLFFLTVIELQGANEGRGWYKRAYPRVLNPEMASASKGVGMQRVVIQRDQCSFMKNLLPEEKDLGAQVSSFRQASDKLFHLLL